MDRPDLYDPGQAICVWRDGLGDYLTALGFGAGGGEYRRWWAEYGSPAWKTRPKRRQ